MTSNIDICNMALSHCRGGTINSLTENSVQAYSCNLFYDTIKDKCLEMLSWGIATKVKTLALLDSNAYPVFTWAYAYQYPSDCLVHDRLIGDFEEISLSGDGSLTYRYNDELNPHSIEIEYELLNINGIQAIVTNQANARLKYRISINNPGEFTATFRLAFSYLLCSAIAPNVIGEDKAEKVIQRCLRMYSSLIDEISAKELNGRHLKSSESEILKEIQS